MCQCVPRGVAYPYRSDYTEQVLPAPFNSSWDQQPVTHEPLGQPQNSSQFCKSVRKSIYHHCLCYLIPTSIMDGALSFPTCDISSELLWTGKSLASALVLGSFAPSTEGVITFITQQSSYAWFFRLTQFETIFLYFIMAQIFVLRWLQVLPINVNKFFDSDPSGRRKKRSKNFGRDPVSFLNQDEIGSSFFKLLRKLDDEECILKALCSVESARLKGHSFAKDTLRLMTTLATSGKRAGIAALVSEEERLEEKRSPWTMRTFQLATLRGQQDFGRNGTLCDSQYSDCSLSSADIIDYMDIITDAGML